MPRHTVSLAVLLPALLAGCSGSAANCAELDLEERQAVFPVPRSEVEARLSPDGTLSEEACAALCTEHAPAHRVEEVLACAPIDEVSQVDTGSELELDCTYLDLPYCIGGRDHVVVSSLSRGASTNPVLAWLQGNHHAETASVKAFLELARELEGLGAPPSLVQACRGAACEEVAHARRLGALVDRRGGKRSPLRFAAVPPRDLVEVAIENAVEGCVREVWAAAVARWQAQHAADPEVRAAMGPIARDEARHGDLARAIHAWAMARLDEADRTRDEAVRSLLRALDVEVDPTLVAAIGLPDRAAGLAIAAALQARLWAAA